MSSRRAPCWPGHHASDPTELAGGLASRRGAWLSGNMFRRVITVALLACATAAGAQTAAVTQTDLRRHIDVLASDRFEGRLPGTAGERLTTDYLVRELTARGLEPAGVDGTWFQPVTLVERGRANQQVTWSGPRGRIAVPPDTLVLTGRDAAARIPSAPVIFVGLRSGGGEIAGANLRGAVVLASYEAPVGGAVSSFAERTQALTQAGAAAVIGIVSRDLPFGRVRAASARQSLRLEQDLLPPIFGAMSWDGATALFRGAGVDLAAAERSGAVRALPIRADIRLANSVRRFTTNNVVGRIRGRAATGQNVVLLGHWDHLGLCRPERAEDRICNGAVDNASGRAVLIEAAGRIAAGPRPARDVLVLATTAEEMGLFGAEAFARTPTVARASIVAAVNVDTSAVAPAGTPIAVIGGTPALKAMVRQVVEQAGLRFDPDSEADVMAQRQDGWALSRNGIPALMASTNASDMNRLRAYLGSTYHGPDDEPSTQIELGGAVDDANLLVQRARAFGDPARWPGAAR